MLYFLLIPIGGFAILALIHWINNRKPTLSGQATVVSHHVEYGRSLRFVRGGGSNWNFFVIFRLSDGEEVTLNMGESEFSALKDGSQGWLTWQGTEFREFDTLED